MRPVTGEDYANYKSAQDVAFEVLNDKIIPHLFDANRNKRMNS